MRQISLPGHTGTTAAPTLLTGTFALSTRPKNVPGDVQVFAYTVIGEAGAVPEPASWTLMITGLGLAGGAAHQCGRVPA